MSFEDVIYITPTIDFLEFLRIVEVAVWLVFKWVAYIFRRFLIIINYYFNQVQESLF